MNNTDITQLSERKITDLQNDALVKQIEYVMQKSSFYQRLFKEHSIDPRSIKRIEDLQKIPFTEKQDLQQYHPDFICVDRSEIIDYTATSGTLSTPVVIPQTEGDLQRLAQNEANSLAIATGTREDIFQLTTTINKQFMAGLAYFMGVRKLGAGIIRIGPGTLQMQWQSILDLRPTALIVVPSFLTKMIDFAIEQQIDFKNSSVTKAICIGESIRNQDFSLNTLGKRITDQWDIDLFSTYASTEMATAFTECQAGVGGHHQPELVITEIVDDNGQIVSDGEAGELVITTLGIEGFPLVRFKTGDICIKYSEPCKCGRNTYRLGPILGRKNHMIKYKGTTLFPTAIYDLLDGLPWIEAYQVQVQKDANDVDEIILNINETSPENVDELNHQLEAKLRVKPIIRLKSSTDLRKLIFQEWSRKPIKFSDLRGLS